MYEHRVGAVEPPPDVGRGTGGRSRPLLMKERWERLENFMKERLERLEKC